MKKMAKRKKSLLRMLIVAGLLLTVVLMVSPVVGAAEETLTIKSAKLSLWPEYDDPRILVMYQGTFADESSFPGEVRFAIPTGSEINQVCALKQPGNEHLCQLYDTIAEPASLAVEYTLPIPTYFLEYYWDGIQGQPEKSFSYEFTAPYAIEKLEIEVQQPLKATGFTLSPKYTSAFSDAQGMKYYRYLLNDVSQGQVITIDAEYTKADSRPSVEKKLGTGTGNDGPNYTIIGILAGAAAVFFIGFVALKRKPAPARAQIRRSAVRAQSLKQAEQNRVSRQELVKQTRTEPTKTKQSARQSAGAAIFCSQCGSKLDAGDAFCHGCGSKAKQATQ